MPRFVFGAVAVSFTLLFGVAVDPSSEIGVVLAVLWVACALGIVILTIRPRLLSFLRGTAVPYLLQLGFGSILTMIATGDILTKVRADLTPAIWSIPATLAGMGIVLYTTAKTRQLERRNNTG